MKWPFYPLTFWTNPGPWKLQCLVRYQLCQLGTCWQSCLDHALWNKSHRIDLSLLDWNISFQITDLYSLHFSRFRHSKLRQLSGKTAWKWQEYELLTTVNKLHGTYWIIQAIQTGPNTQGTTANILRTSSKNNKALTNNSSFAVGVVNNWIATCYVAELPSE